MGKMSPDLTLPRNRTAPSQQNPSLLYPVFSKSRYHRAPHVSLIVGNTDFQEKLPGRSVCENHENPPQDSSASPYRQSKASASWSVLYAHLCGTVLSARHETIFAAHTDNCRLPVLKPRWILIVHSGS